MTRQVYIDKRHLPQEGKSWQTEKIRQSLKFTKLNKLIRVLYDHKFYTDIIREFIQTQPSLNKLYNLEKVVATIRKHFSDCMNTIPHTEYHIP